MRKKIRKKTRKPVLDENQTAAKIVDFVSRQAAVRKKNPAAVALGRLGGLKGGKARAEKLDPEQRRQIASNAARARWSKASS